MRLSLNDIYNSKYTIPTSGIYQIRHIDTNKVYIGSSNNIRSRLKRHIKNLRKNIHDNKHMQNAWNLYGEEYFDFSILEEVLDIETILLVEQSYLDKYIIDNIVDTNRCFNHSIKANKPPALYGKDHPLFGKPSSRRGIPISQETRDKISKANTGMKRSEATRKKLSERTCYLKGKEHPMYGKIGILSPIYGRKKSPETIQKIRETKIGNKNPMFGKKAWNNGKRVLEHVRQAAIKANSIVWDIHLLSPDGSIHHVYDNLTAFCKIHNLNDGNIGKVIRGERKSSSGWKLFKENVNE